MDALEAFERAYASQHESDRKRLAEEHLIYCLCCREFPDGQIGRILYGAVHYAENRCGECQDTSA